MSSFCVFTIISKNYLPYARVLMKSFSDHHPGVRRIVILADRNVGHFDSSKEDFEVIEVENLGIRDFTSLAFKYNILELNTAVKPKCSISIRILWCSALSTKYSMLWSRIR
jgi:hypothetical protein